ncbi:MAG TPA: SDR family oxidoreductase [Burkholderiaceae bacterium]|jgi:NAD(P)-dependent dehydrogenase (short-subunit alcohol dehydrogenase family)|nr:SDR family oxidoreductase [Burkholderiaceae bacterium]
MSILDLLRPVPGLRVLVTAGAGGVGAVIARAFHATGARVHVCDIDRSALDRLSAEVPGLTGSMADVSVAADVELVFDNVQGALGGLDVLVSSAAISGPTGPIEAIDGPGWERTIAVNLNSQFYFARRAVPMLKQSPSGPSLITIGSVAGRLGFGFRAPHTSSTWAVVGLMKSLAVELGPHGIRVNAILSGTIDSAGLRAAIAAGAAAAGAGAEETHEHDLNTISLRRRVGADDVAALALFLCSPAARNLTGQAVSVDGNAEYL